MFRNDDIVLNDESEGWDSSRYFLREKFMVGQSKPMGHVQP